MSENLPDGFEKKIQLSLSYAVLRYALLTADAKAGGRMDRQAVLSYTVRGSAVGAQ